MRCPGEGRIGWSPRRTSPSTTLPAVAAAASARRKSRSKPRTFSPSMPSPKGISDCSIEVGNHDVEADHLGAALHDGTEHAAHLAGPGQRRRTLEWCGAFALLVDRDHDRRRGGGIVPAPNISQRSAVRMSSDSPWIGLTTGETEGGRANQRDHGDRNRVARRAPDFKMRGPTTPIPCAASGRRSASRRAWPAGRPGIRPLTT